MKVGDSKGPKSASGTKKSSSAHADGSVDFSQYVNKGSSETSNVSTTQSIAQLDSLLAVQEVEDPTERAARKRAHFRADNILEKLDQIRIKMLGGNLTVGHMVDVADVIASHRDKINDPALTAIMDEIDLRAQVELAKMQVSMDSSF